MLEKLHHWNYCLKEPLRTLVSLALVAPPGLLLWVLPGWWKLIGLVWLLVHVVTRNDYMVTHPDGPKEKPVTDIALETWGVKCKDKNDDEK